MMKFTSNRLGQRNSNKSHHTSLEFTSSSRSLVRKFLSWQWYSNISGDPTDFSVASSNSILDILANSPTFSWGKQTTNQILIKSHIRALYVLKMRSVKIKSNKNKNFYLWQKLAEVADLNVQVSDLLLHWLLVTVFSINCPQRLIVFRMNLPGNHDITSTLIPEQKQNKIGKVRSLLSDV